MEIGKKAFQGGDSSSVTTVRDLSTSAVFHEFVNAIIVDLSKILYCSHASEKKGKKQVNIAVIGMHSIFCESFLGDQVMEKKLFRDDKLLGKGFAGDGRFLREKSV
jgi:hypothetical protein